MSVADNLARIRKAIGSRPVQLVAVTKHASIAQVEEAFEHGVTEFGENRIQDAMAKREVLSPHVASSVNWHFIGHLQTNKVKQAVGNFALIHSVDSLRLAREISRVAVQKGVQQKILLQVKVEEDANKSGFTAHDIRQEFAEVLQLPNLNVQGLMTITPLAADEAQRLRCFEGLRKLRDELESAHDVVLRELSMGMTGDWSEAIACGATMIRLGTAIFAA